MNDILGSAAFQEFLQKRVEEIAANDKTVSTLRRRMAKIENELMPLLTDQAVKKYLEYEELMQELDGYIGPILYSNGLSERKIFIDN